MKIAKWTMVMALVMNLNAWSNQEADAFDASFASKAKDGGLWDRFSFGSYGELHARVGDGADNIDMHRLVAMLNFQATEKVRFVTETEFEHVFYHDEDNGTESMQIEIEQAYIEYMLQHDLLLNAGIQLVPVGIINEVHEPTTFYGVERPNVEKYLIPTTWWEAALGVTKNYDSGLRLDAMLHTGLNMSKDGYIRSGRPKLDLNDYTEGNSWAVTTRAKYTGIPGLELGGALQYQQDVSSSVSGNQDSYLAEAHAIYRDGGFELRALASYWNVDGFADPNTEDQWGYYVEPSYKIEALGGELGAFCRWSQYEYFNAGRRHVDEVTIGLNYWPMEEVVLKADYLVMENGNSDSESFNFGIGYYF